jgi:hypothetical protein
MRGLGDSLMSVQDAQFYFDYMNIIFDSLESPHFSEVIKIEEIAKTVEENSNGLLDALTDEHLQGVLSHNISERMRKLRNKDESEWERLRIPLNKIAGYSLELQNTLSRYDLLSPYNSDY